MNTRHDECSYYAGALCRIDNEGGAGRYVMSGPPLAPQYRDMGHVIRAYFSPRERGVLKAHVRLLNGKVRRGLYVVDLAFPQSA